MWRALELLLRGEIGLTIPIDLAELPDRHANGGNMGWLGDVFSDHTGPAILLGGKRFKPKQFGEAVAVWSVDSSEDTVRSFIELGKGHSSADNIFSRMLSMPRLAQMQVVAYHAAIYLIGVAMLPGMKNEVLLAVQNGITQNLASSRMGPGTGEMMNNASGLYAKSLYTELNTPQEDLGLRLDSGPTAGLLFELLTESYKSHSSFEKFGPLEISPIDEMLLQTTMRAVISGSLTAFNKMQLQFQR